MGASWWRLIHPATAARRTCQGWMIFATRGFQGGVMPRRENQRHRGFQ